MTEIKGVIIPIASPLTKDEQLHERGMRQLVKYLLGNGAHGIYIMGSSGVGTVLTDEVKMRTIEITMQEIGGRVPVLIGCSENGFKRTLKWVRVAEKMKAQAVVIHPPYFYKYTQEDIYNYYKEISQVTSLPVYLYDIFLAGNKIEPDTVIRLSKTAENVVGIKTDDNVYDIRVLTNYFRKKENFTVLAGTDYHMDLSLLLGVKGVIAGPCNIVPHFAVKLYDAIQAGDFNQARKWQEEIISIMSVYEVESIFGGFTAAMNLLGIEGNFVTKPYSDISKKGREKVKKILQEHSLI